ncbi:MAG: ATP-dependent helicase HrpB, partial [Myxococcales bacterium]|nr:ATP-dependent helicase HrpB [Myxococcales bacterium]
MPNLPSLPVDARVPDIVAQVRTRGALVLTAEPGAGKTTRVSPALMDADDDGEVWVVEPRRLAARMAAARVADERGTKLGDEVGYTVRFDDRTSKRTRLRFVTEGIFVRRLTTDPTLAGVDVVVFDEFHERNLDGDLGLGWVEALR